LPSAKAERVFLKERVMEMELNSLIEKIKQEGIAESNKKSQEIIKQAEEKKIAIIKQAEQQAASMIKQAEQEAARLKDNSHKAINQAVRDAVLSLRQEIEKLFDASLKKEVQRSLSDDFIKELILKIAGALPGGKQTGLEISLSPQDKKRLEGIILSGLKKELAAGISFKVNPNIEKGLYVGIKGEDFHYDFSDEAILDTLREYLRPFILQIIEKK
jgi:V/A-type H+-transporting ATPase subunit E